ncbi:polysaccharide pyruvyl transferase family protein [Microbacterium aquimaris]|uniref:polysaccharide pyruvyl transferase family protein n=1 Tax=Microbacterium aquimaris TaxID=459816 RepID=UPI002AD24C01|nr:polysaccharide pyruvyl transferase family protein [Microbacterium aquimaris]MDZ8274820.1 polysaccharide pyruvyl transferase family protein [Microbacterium aquimaris]
MKNTVAVLTLVDLQNYGNRLQNYAVHQLLSGRGFAPWTVEVRRTPWKSVARTIAYTSGAVDLRHSKSARGRAKAFASFTRAHAPFVTVRPDDVDKLAQRFDFFSVGSDQVWNPNDSRLGGLSTGLQFLAGIDASRKTTISPSFGLSQIPAAWQARYGEWLSTFDRMSTREREGASLIRSLSGRAAEVLIDPTLALPAEAWTRIARASQTPERPYVIRLFLGGTSPSRERALTEFAQRNGLTIVDLGDRDAPISNRSGPAEFISLVQNASLIATDSFHCAVFAFLFNRPLAIYQRIGHGAAMGSRISTFSQTFSLGDRLVQENCGTLDQLLEHDYSVGYEQLKLERSRFHDYLDDEARRLFSAVDGESASA